MTLFISTHALTEGDRLRCHSTSRNPLFQLTPSRRATLTMQQFPVIFSISTHALTEGDIDRYSSFFEFCLFQLTPSRRATLIFCRNDGICRVYFNSRPHGGRQLRFLLHSAPADYFNSRPHGGRQANLDKFFF